MRNNKLGFIVILPSLLSLQFDTNLKNNIKDTFLSGGVYKGKQKNHSFFLAKMITERTKSFGKDMGLPCDNHNETLVQKHYFMKFGKFKF